MPVFMQDKSGHDGEGAHLLRCFLRNAMDGARPPAFGLRVGGWGVALQGAPEGMAEAFASWHTRAGGRPVLKSLSLPIEQRRRDGGIAFASQSVADRANVMIDAEDFLDDHDAAFGGVGRVGAIGTQLKLVG